MRQLSWQLICGVLAVAIIISRGSRVWVLGVAVVMSTGDAGCILSETAGLSVSKGIVGLHIPAPVVADTARGGGGAAAADR